MFQNDSVYSNSSVNKVKMSFKYFYCKLLFCIFLSETALSILNGTEQDLDNITHFMTNLTTKTSSSESSTSTTEVTHLEDTTITTTETTQGTKKPTDRPKLPKGYTSKPILDRIDFSNFRLTHLPSGIFNACRRATYIDLSHNDLKFLPSNTFKTIDHVEFLNLSANALKYVDPKWFTSFSSFLRRLDLSKNLLEIFPISEFPVMPNLKNLILSGNKLHDVDARNFMEKFMFLKHIDLQYNQIGCLRDKTLKKLFTGRNVNYVTQKNMSISDLKCINDSRWTYKQLSLVMDDLRETKETVRSLFLALVVTGSVLFVLILAMFGCLVFVFWKTNMKTLNGTTNQRTLQTDFGYYYNPNEEFAEPSVSNNDAQTTEENEEKPGVVYATIERPAKKEKEETAV